LFEDRIIRAAAWASSPIEARLRGREIVRIPIVGEVDNGETARTYEELRKEPRRFMLIHDDARNLDLPDGSVDYVVTDPPYYDSVQYGDLSRFFRVWLRLLLPGVLLWDYDQSSAAVAQRQTPDEGKYCETLADIWRVCAKVLMKDHGRLIFTYHHWRPNAWAELTISLKRAGFVLVNRYVVFSENPISVHIRKLRALKHDVILILKPKSKEEPVRSWSRIRKVESDDGARFCRDCGSVLGWLLNSEYEEAEIRREWHSIIEAN
jgi:adenine-specific DNA methylase